jgi:hypothetical protein
LKNLEAFAHLIEDERLREDHQADERLREDHQADERLREDHQADERSDGAPTA